MEHGVGKASVDSLTSETGNENCQLLTFMDSHTSSKIDQKPEGEILLDSDLELSMAEKFNYMASVNTKISDVQAEIKNVQLELQHMVSMYGQACNELGLVQYKVQLLSSKCQKEAERVDAAQKREATLRRIAAQEKEKCLDAMMEVNLAKDLLAKETCGRQKAELSALRELSERQKIADALFSVDGGFRMYTIDEIEIATEFFSESNVIGEGGYGKVYKCNIDHTLVAVKVLCPDASEKKEEFLREVEVLSHMYHPNVVLFFGACSQIGCLVYEYMENGSLEDCIFRLNGKLPLPWSVRFRIVFEVACGLAFLHGAKPEPIVHQDLKPNNILLGKNHVSKIGDVGLAKLLSNAVPDGVMEYNDTQLAGTLNYMDPEYHRTGTLRPKSDLYAFGVIILQLLTARHPNKLVLMVEKALSRGFLVDLLDKSIADWPLAETEELAHVALKCSKLRCRDWLDLVPEVLPVLRRLACMEYESQEVRMVDIGAPTSYFCPILQDSYIRGLHICQLGQVLI